MVQNSLKKAFSLVLTQILAYVKYSQQVAAILFWFLTFGLLFGLSVTTLQEHIGGVPFLGLLPSHIELGSIEMLKIYGVVSLVYYLIVSVIRFFWPRKPLGLGVRIKRASLFCLVAYVLAFAFIPFIRMAPGQARSGMAWIIGIFAIGTYLATIYAICVSRLLDKVADILHATSD